MDLQKGFSFLIARKRRERKLGFSEVRIIAKANESVKLKRGQGLGLNRRLLGKAKGGEREFQNSAAVNRADGTVFWELLFRL
jgi:hypothetical protein